MLKIGIFGVCGKMGKMIAELAEKDEQIALVSAMERKGHSLIDRDLGELLGGGHVGTKISDNIDEVLESVECMIDFTLPDPTIEHLEACVEKNVPIVIGTTGFTSEQEKLILEASRSISMVFSPNMAVGVNLLFNIVSEAARVLGHTFDIKVDETHHIHKKDSPSGTAKMIAKIIAETCGKDPEVEAFREGEVIGNHGICYDGEFETLEIRHNAKTRNVFASGAITAAKYAATKIPGLYTMSDVLGLAQYK